MSGHSLCRDDHYSIRRVGSVPEESRAAFEDSDGGNLVRVDVGNSIEGLGYTVYDVQQWDFARDANGHRRWGRLLSSGGMRGLAGASGHQSD